MFSETIELRGHIIDSLILPKVLDEILKGGGNFNIAQVKIGQKRADQSFARIEVSSESSEALDDLILRLRQHGAEVAEKGDAELAPAPADGIFPNDFYVTTNRQTFVRLAGKELEVHAPMLDSAIMVDRSKDKAQTLRFAEVRKGMDIVVGHQGVRVVPSQRATTHTDVFQLFNTNISAEHPKGALIREIGRELEKARVAGKKILIVAGAPIVHTGAAEYLVQMIKGGHVNVLISGNALAVYDIESALFGTALGLNLEGGALSETGHENYMRGINIVRSAGGVGPLVEAGTLTSGIMHACVKHKVDVLLTGSIRDDGPLPEVVTDSMEGQRLIREKIQDVDFAVLMGTMFHSIAVANLLAGNVKTLAVDINPAVVAKLTDQQTFGALGLVTDIEPFMRELTECLKALRQDAQMSR